MLALKFPDVGAKTIQNRTASFTPRREQEGRERLLLMHDNACSRNIKLSKVRLTGSGAERNDCGSVLVAIKSATKQLPNTQSSSASSAVPRLASVIRHPVTNAHLIQPSQQHAHRHCIAERHSRLEMHPHVCFSLALKCLSSLRNRHGCTSCP